MRLCYIADPRSIHTRRWLEYFVHQGHEVHLLTFYTDFIPLEGVKIHAIFPPSLNKIKRGRGWLALLCPWRIRQIIYTISPDILHAHFISFYGWMAALSGFHPFVLTIWGSDMLVPGSVERFPRYWLTPLALKKADIVNALSKHLLAVAGQYVKSAVDGHVTYLLPNLSDFNPSLDAKSWRTQLELGDRPVVLSPRAFAPVYNIETIVAALPYVLERVPDVCFVFLAKTDVRQEAYRNRIQQMITNMKVETAVRFVDEVSNHNEMGKLYRLADVVLSVSRSDATIPATGFEAMACGVPLILGWLPQFEEIITSEENALIVSGENSQKLAEAIVRLLKDKALAQKIIMTNLTLIKEKGDFQAQMAKMEKLYKNLLF